MEARKTGKFTDVLHHWPPNTFFEFPFCGCNLSIRDGLEVELPTCQSDDDIIT